MCVCVTILPDNCHTTSHSPARSKVTYTQFCDYLHWAQKESPPGTESLHFTRSEFLTPSLTQSHSRRYIPVHGLSLPSDPLISCKDMHTYAQAHTFPSQLIETSPFPQHRPSANLVAYTLTPIMAI